MAVSYDEYYWIMPKYPVFDFVIKFKLGKKIKFTTT